MTSKNTGLTESITSKNQEFSHLKSEENIHFFEKLIDQTETRAYSAALRLTHDKDEADDLVQETYIKAWKNFGRYIKEKPFINWILKMMQRLYIDKKRGSRFSDRTESTCRCISTKTGLPQEMEIADTCPTPASIFFCASLACSKAFSLVSVIKHPSSGSRFSISSK